MLRKKTTFYDDLLKQFSKYNSPCHRESENQYKENEEEDDGTKGGRQDVQLGL